MDQIVQLMHTVIATVVSTSCADTMLVEGDLFNPPCLKLCLSKALGYGVVLGATIVKVPQIVKIVANGSATGVSLTSHLLELAAYTITLTRAMKMGFPFSTWGESLFITGQLWVLVFLILVYNRQTLGALPFAAVYGAATLLLLDQLTTVDDSLQVSMDQHMALQSYVATPLSSMARLVQIVAIVRSGTTGQLSHITAFLNLAGTLARVFTTLQEVDDVVILTSFLVSAALNGAIVAMCIFYPSGEVKAQEVEKKTK